jgi:hypothetical protein
MRSVGAHTGNNHARLTILVTAAAARWERDNVVLAGGSGLFKLLLGLLLCENGRVARRACWDRLVHNVGARLGSNKAKSGILLDSANVVYRLHVRIGAWHEATVPQECEDD